MQKVIFYVSIIFVGLSLGYAFQILVNKKMICPPSEMLTIRKTLQKMALLFFIPISTLGAVWVVNLDNLKILVLPFIGITALVLGGLIAFWFSKKLRHTRKQTGAYVVSGGFTGIGSIGGLLCFVFLGEIGFALLPFYKLFEEFSYYSIGFPIAKSFSSEKNKSESFKQRLKKIFTDVFILTALGSMIIGIMLNLSGIQRPEFYKTIISYFIPTANFLLLVSIGMAVQFGQAGRYIKEGFLMVLIKFVIVPVTATSMAYLIGLDNIDQGLPLKVVLILSSMPVGFIAMVPPTIYDLDIDIANASWLATNFMLLLIIPFLAFLLSMF